ncbi:hypothetical protein CVT26_015420 [Gymnopilus dilepis]|uniref:Uncharacterized protein n=1 Tax=Gymnopilus dilepis TaxID=231916 RepID=A0A409YEF4_9AGAR|nr:hypothetical protein CVT26_015420 [Gymnopilus dilepis]
MWGSHVPSDAAFCQIQEGLQSVRGTEPEQHVPSLGNMFYSNNIGESVARDFANPEIAKHVQLYPEEKDGPISEVWQAERWREFKPSGLTPMFSRGHLAQLQDGRYILRQNLIMRKGELASDCHVVMPNKNGWTISEEVQVISTTSFKYNYLDIVSAVPGDAVPWADESKAPVIPNPLREPELTT